MTSVRLWEENPGTTANQEGCSHKGTQPSSSSSGAAGARSSWPCVLKPPFTPQRTERGGQSSHAKHVVRQLIRRWHKNARATGPSQSVRSTPQQESVADAVPSREEKTLPAIPGRRRAEIPRCGFAQFCRDQQPSRGSYFIFLLAFRQ